MAKNRNGKSTVVFSLYETAKPKFHSDQIRIDSANLKTSVGLPKSPQKLAVGRAGKIGFSK